jgi:hypothetical protein
MATITLKINERSKAGKMVKDLLELIADKPGVEIIEAKSHYNPEFIKKIKKSEQQIKEGKVKILNTDDIWGSLGLVETK